MGSAERKQGIWAREVALDPDMPAGTYVVALQAMGQGGEVVASRQITLTVSPHRR